MKKVIVMAMISAITYHASAQKGLSDKSQANVKTTQRTTVAATKAAGATKVVTTASTTATTNASTKSAISGATSTKAVKKTTSTNKAYNASDEARENVSKNPTAAEHSAVTSEANLEVSATEKQKPAAPKKGRKTGQAKDKEAPKADDGITTLNTESEHKAKSTFAEMLEKRIKADAAEANVNGTRAGKNNE